MAHVAFDGWTESTFQAAAADIGMEREAARMIYPRGALDLAVAYHKAGDAAMRAALEDEDLTELRFRDRVAHAVRLRLETADREVIRRGATLFSLPQHSATGASLIWGTADAIWSALGDSSTDGNWYSKRAILAGVYGATVLYWLGDESEGQARSWEFLDRRIDNVMQFEKTKAQLRENPLTRPFMAGTDRLMARLRAPSQGPQAGMPGSWTTPSSSDTPAT